VDIESEIQNTLSPPIAELWSFYNIINPGTPAAAASVRRQEFEIITRSIIDTILKVDNV